MTKRLLFGKRTVDGNYKVYFDKHFIITHFNAHFWDVKLLQQFGVNDTMLPHNNVGCDVHPLRGSSSAVDVVSRESSFGRNNRLRLSLQIADVF